MFKINLRQLLRVLFILGLLLPTYLLPSSSTSNVAFAEGGLEETDALQDVEALELEGLEGLKERGGECQRIQFCIGELTPAVGEPIGNEIGFSGIFPAGSMEFTLRDSRGEIAYQEVIEHDGSSKVEVKLANYEWQEDQYSVTLIGESVRGRGRSGESIDLDVVRSDDGLIRGGGGAFDLHKISKPRIGQPTHNKHLAVIGTFDSAPVEISVRFPSGEVSAKILKYNKNQLVMELERGAREFGTYSITIKSKSGGTDTIYFGVGEPDRSPFSRGCARRW